MIYDIETVKRLVPEAERVKFYEDGTFSFSIDDCLYFSDDHPVMKLLLDTRRQLEIARYHLTEMSGGDKQFPDTTPNERLARDTLAAIEAVK